MRTALILAALGLGSTALAQQIPIPAFASTFTGAATRGFFFQAPASFLITGLQTPNEAAQPFQAIEVIDLGLVPPPAYPGTIVGTQLYYSNNTVGGSLISTSIPCVAGNYYGILGASTPSVGSSTSYNSYAGVTGAQASTILGIPTTLTRFGTQFGIGAGGNNPCWQEVGGTFCRVNVFVTPTGGGTVATVAPYGSGCGSQFASFYENFATAAAFDLAGTSIQMLSTGTGFVVTPGGAYNPVGALGTPTTLALGDDTSVAAGTLGITVHSNGFVSLAAGNGDGFTPDVPTFLSNPATAYYCWHDLNPSTAGSGQVKYEEAGVLAQITYDGVWDYGGTSAANANFIQFQINTATGGAVICWGTMSTAGNGFLVGYSPGGPSIDPGNSDLSTLGANPIVTYGSDQGALSLTAIGRPVEGAAAVNFQVTTGNIPASALLHVGIIGLSNPAVPLSLIGAPGCTLYADLIVILGPVVGPGPLTQTWTGLTLPAAPPSNAGFQFRLQSAILGTQQNQALGLGVLTSNGLLCTVGNL